MKKKIACYVGKVKDMPKFEKDMPLQPFQMSKHIEDLVMGWACGFISADGMIAEGNRVGYNTDEILFALLHMDRQVHQEQKGE